MDLIPTDTPDLTSSESLTGTSSDKTLYLKIDLNVPVATGQEAVAPMTAVFAPDPTQLGSSAIDVLLWFHGYKGQLGNINLKGYTAKQYLNVAQFKLREFIANDTSKRKFVLVVPTLGDKAGAGLLERQDQAEAFLQQVLNGIKKHMGAKGADIGNIVLAAHSGGGSIMNKVVGFTGTFASKIQEVWCFDCTYPGYYENCLPWAKVNPSDKLWVFSTGESGPRLPHPTLPEGPDNKMIKRAGTGDGAHAILKAARDGVPPLAFVEVRINNHVDFSGTRDLLLNFKYPPEFDHNGSVKAYFAKLVGDSGTLK